MRLRGFPNNRKPSLHIKFIYFYEILKNYLEIFCRISKFIFDKEFLVGLV